MLMSQLQFVSPVITKLLPSDSTHRIKVVFLNGSAGDYVLKRGTLAIEVLLLGKQKPQNMFLYITTFFNLPAKVSYFRQEHLVLGQSEQSVSAH